MATRARGNRPIMERFWRPPNFPYDPRMEKLITSNFDPAVGYFELSMNRRHARALRMDAEFIPPTMREEPPIPPQWPENLAA